MSLDEQFDKAVEDIKNLKETPANEDLLEVYALFKQATVGDCNTGLNQKEELDLDRTPLCDKFLDKNPCIREVQKSPPRMTPIHLEEELVPSQPSFLCDPVAADVIRLFFHQYYYLYDSDSRAPLLDAYHEDAQFSLACSFHTTASSFMAPYLQESRNLLVVKNPYKVKRLLKRGKVNIVAYLSSLPKTQHDPLSLTVDCPIFSSKMFMVSLVGVFREVGDEKHHTIKSFQRTFILVPVGTGFCIINELFQITPATANQLRVAFRAPKITPTSQASPSETPAMVTLQAVDVATQWRMVSTLSMQSGMNLSWSEKCLSENGWDFIRSIFIVIDLKKRKKIPAEAFIK